jgi:hypothetical protein
MAKNRIPTLKYSTITFFSKFSGFPPQAGVEIHPASRNPEILGKSNLEESVLF